jgi:hypothetical protein
MEYREFEKKTAKLVDLQSLDSTRKCNNDGVIQPNPTDSSAIFTTSFLIGSPRIASDIGFSQSLTVTTTIYSSITNKAPALLPWTSGK